MVNTSLAAALALCFADNAAILTCLQGIPTRVTMLIALRMPFACLASVAAGTKLRTMVFGLRNYVYSADLRVD